MDLDKLEQLALASPKTKPPLYADDGEEQIEDQILETTDHSAVHRAVREGRGRCWASFEARRSGLGMSRAEVARRSGLSYNTVLRVFEKPREGQPGICIETILKIANVLEIDVTLEDQAVLVRSNMFPGV